MDINTLRALTTLVSLLIFVAIVGWAWSRRRRDDFQRAAQLPFDQD